MVEHQVNSRDFPQVYDRIGVELNELGCVMLGVKPLPIRESLQSLPEDALFWSPDPRSWWIKGPVGQERGHITLLYGILKQLWRTGGLTGDYFTAIDTVLADWEQPAAVAVEDILLWPDPAGGPSTTIVAEIRVTDAVLEAHQRLSLLPHVDTFLGYRPHVTLAYVRSEYAEEAAAALEYNIPSELATTELDYGHPA